MTTTQTAQSFLPAGITASVRINGTVARVDTDGYIWAGLAIVTEVTLSAQLWSDSLSFPGTENRATTVTVSIQATVAGKPFTRFPSNTIVIERSDGVSLEVSIVSQNDLWWITYHERTSSVPTVEDIAGLKPGECRVLYFSPATGCGVGVREGKGGLPEELHLYWGQLQFIDVSSLRRASAGQTLRFGSLSRPVEGKRREALCLTLVS